jgi:hypothetical protein
MPVILSALPQCLAAQDHNPRRERRDRKFRRACQTDPLHCAITAAVGINRPRPEISALPSAQYAEVSPARKTAMCSGPIPQQPPSMLAPVRRQALANSR